AGFPQRTEVGAFRYEVTEGERTGRPDRQGLARLEALEINEVQQYQYAVFRDAVLTHQPVAAGGVDGDVAQDPWEARRGLLPGQPAMTEIDRRNAGKPKERRHGFEVVLTVDQVRGRTERIEIVNHRHGQ